MCYCACPSLPRGDSRYLGLKAFLLPSLVSLESPGVRGYVVGMPEQLEKMLLPENTSIVHGGGSLESLVLSRRRRVRAKLIKR